MGVDVTVTIQISLRGDGGWFSNFATLRGGA